jgi:hypothetical protein
MLDLNVYRVRCAIVKEDDEKTAGLLVYREGCQFDEGTQLGARMKEVEAEVS